MEPSDNRSGTSPTAPRPRWRNRIPSSRQWLVDGGWWTAVVAAISLFSVALPVRYFQLVELRFAKHSDAEILRVVQPEGVTRALQALGMATDTYAMATVVMEAMYAFVFCAVALLARTRIQNRQWGLFVSLTLVVFGTSAIPTVNALTEVNPAFETVDRLLNSTAWMLFGLFYFLFPDGRFPLPATRALAWVWMIWSLSYALFPSSPLNPLRWPAAMAIAVWLVWFGTGVIVQVYRFVRLSTPVQRQQTKWVMYGWGAAFLLGVAFNLPGVIYPTMDTPGHPGALYELVRGPLTNTAILIAPVSLGLAILRYRLWDIDLIINRTLVYVPLTALLAGFYSASVALSQRMFILLTGEKSDAVIVFVTLLLATAFSSLRLRLQAVVDRVFREAPDPTRELRSLGNQVRAVVDVVDQRELAARFLLEAVESFDAEGGAVYLMGSEGWQTASVLGEWQEDRAALSIPLESDGTAFGRLALGPRAPGLEYGMRERSVLLETAGIVASALKGTAPVV